MKTANILLIAMGAMGIFSCPALVQAQSEPESYVDQSQVQATASTENDVQFQVENGVTYLCGGIGSDESNKMKHAARDHDLMLTFAQRNGEYLADVNIAILNARGNALLKTTCSGPILLVDFPRTGTYRIRAEANGYTLNKTVQVSKKRYGRSVVLLWPRQVTRTQEVVGASSLDNSTP